ncbi:putative conserved fungal protein [Diaporthe ampelina]|uniref:Putative conserved fungal protein n=1 Tax=Diaporthe ampelina TaxID=1214573 RepID=A0A0G2I559_9PEZI|nr:putative conserved fungal protein [Diaporthe ampelina]
MPTIFSFEQGNERSRYPTDSSPLLGRFRAVPRTGGGTASNRRGSLGLLSRASWRGSVHVGYGSTALLAGGLGDDDDDESDDDDEAAGGEAYDGAGSGRRRKRLAAWCRRRWKRMDDLWINPKQGAVRRVASVWYSRWFVLVVLPAALAVGWCAIPFPQYPLRDGPDDGSGGGNDGSSPPHGGDPGHRKPRGHGRAKAEVNFWFFLFVYYAFYNLTALVWITKVFNLYSLNWWPSMLGFPLTICMIALLGTVGPAVLYYIPEAEFLTVHNTVWITWTFCIMAMPVVIASFILLTKERHMGLRNSLSETQRIFTSSWWAGDDGFESPETRANGRRRPDQHLWNGNESALQIGAVPALQPPPSRRIPVRLKPRFFPASFVRFVWFWEAYAEVYLRTLPHNSLDTIVYFMLTYQTYVRALYARLRSPSQFILLQVLSSSGLIILTPILLSAPVHWLLTAIGVNGQSYAAYQKVGVRNVFIRFVAENASMLCFLGSVATLHFGANKAVYPYFSFDEDDSSVSGDPYDYTFELTFYASAVTWACELAASCIVAGLIKWIYGVNVVTEGSLDLAVWPELLPTSVVVVLHVLQNMLFSIVRLQFR